MSACPTTSPDLPTDLRPEPRPGLLSEAVDIRPLAEHDAHLVSEVFEGLSPLSRFLRFHTPTPRLSRTLVQALATTVRVARDAAAKREASRVIDLHGCTGGASSRLIASQTNPIRYRGARIRP